MGTIAGVGAMQAEHADSPQTLFKIVPAETFDAIVNGEKNVYVKGMKYRVDQDNTGLLAVVEDWILTGKVTRSK